MLAHTPKKGELLVTGRIRILKVGRMEHMRDFLLLEALQRRGRKLRRQGMPVLAARTNDEIGQEIAVQGAYEKHLLQSITTFLLPHAVPDASSSAALDVGANIGNHSIFLSPYFAKVIAIEPNPSAAILLRANLDANNISNVDLHPVGLSDQTGTLLFAEDRFNLGGSHFLSSDDQDVKACRFQVWRGDELISSLHLTNRIALVKLDVEGMERRVISGLRETICRHRPLVLFEAWTGKQARETAGSLTELGYQFFYSVDRRRTHAKSRWLRRVHRLLSGASFYCEQITTFGDWVHPLLVAAANPIEFS